LLSFATEFPVHHDHNVERFFDAVRQWLSGSPHTDFTANDLAGIGSLGEWSGQRGIEQLQTLTYVSETREQGAVRYTRNDAGLASMALS
jgi:hypothetical protein